MSSATVAPAGQPQTKSLTERKAYDPYTTPPDLSLCKVHQRATAVGIKAPFRQLSAAEQTAVIQRLCPCCGVDPESQELSVFCDNMKLADLGAGYVMYFKLVIAFGLIIILVCIPSIFKLAKNVRSSNCLGESDLTNTKTLSTNLYYNYAIFKNDMDLICTKDWITVHSVANYGWAKDTGERDWSVFLVLLYWVILSFIKIYIKRTNKTIDVKNDTPSDWTLQVSNLPPDEPAETIARNFQESGTNGGIPCYVSKINFAYKTEEFDKLAEEVAKLKRECKTLQVKEMPQAIEKAKARSQAKEAGKEGDKKQKDDKKIIPKKDDFSPELQKKVEQAAEKGRELNELRLRMLKEPAKYAWGIAFITFQTKKIADMVETKWGYSMSFSLSNITKIFQSNKKYIYHRNGSTHSTDIKVVRAPNPNDIIWPNLGVSWASLITRTLTTYFVTAILLGMSFGALVGLKVLQFNMSSGTDTSSSGTFKFRAISVCISLIITIINQMLGRSIKALTHTERHATLTAYFQSLVIKVVAVVSF